MRYSLQVPVSRVDAGDEFISAEAICEMARAAEGAGFDACSVSEHPFPPLNWLNSGGHHTLDPLVTFGIMAAVTTRLRLHAGVWVLPYRNAFLSANALASLDAASGGRLIAGVAAGYLEAEFRALGADFEHRNEVSDQVLRDMKQAWTGEPMEISGVSHRLRPLPHQKPHPPIWVGGNSRRAIRRAVDMGDGWMPFPNTEKAAPRTRTAKIETLDDLAERIGYAREYASRVGRKAPLDICFVPFGRRMDSHESFEPDSFLDHASELAAMGVTWLLVALPGDTRSALCESIVSFGETVIAPGGAR